MKAKQLFLTVIFFILGIINSNADTWTDGDGNTWSFTITDTTNKLVRLDGLSSDGNATVPGSVYVGEDEYRVSSIQSRAFQFNSNIIAIGDLPACTSIGQYAFYICTSLTSIGDLSACTSIGVNAFYNCPLANINVKDIALWCKCKVANTFLSYGNSKKKLIVNGEECTNLVIPDGVESIADGAFRSFGYIESVSLPNSISSIGSNSFYNCSSLSTIGDFQNCTTIGASAFQNCSSLTSLPDLSSCITIGNYAFSDCSKLTSIDDLSVCTTIGACAFQNCSSLTNLPDLSSCITMGSYAFSGCSKLTSIGDLSACTTIGVSAFQNCSSLTNLPDLSSCITMNSYAFSGCSKLTSIGDLSACTTIGVSAFQNCNHILEITLLNTSISSIGASAFSGCTLLAKAELGSLDVPTLGSSAFPSTTIVSVPAGTLANYSTADNWSTLYTNNQLIEKGDYYKYTANITSMDDKSALHMNIGDANLRNVVDLTIKGTMNSYDLGIIVSKMPALRYLDLTDATIEANEYEYTTGYHSEDNVLGDYALARTNSSGTLNAALNLATIKLPKNITKIGAYAFSGNSLLTSVTMQPSVATIGGYAFNNCTALMDVDLSATAITDIPAYTFNKCTSLKNVELPANLAKVNGNTFYQCTALGSIEIPATVTSIASNAFGNSSSSSYACTGLKNLTFAANSQLTTIASNAFINCTSLQNFTLPASVTTIGDYAFKNCTSLTDVTLSPGITTVGNYMFQGCTKLASVSMPSTVTKIGNYAFNNCSALTEFQIPESVESIGTYAFNGCSKLQDVYSYTVEPTTIDDNTFSTYTTATLHVPEQAYYTYYYNTQWKKFLNLSTVSKDFAYFYINNDLTLEKSTGDLGTEPEGKLYPESGLIIKETIDQTLGDTHYVVDDNGTSHGSSIIVDGGSLKMGDGKKFYQDIKVTKDKWYYFCFPFDVNLADIVKDGNWIFREYDGDERAKGNTGWKNLDADCTKLTAGKGYIFQTNTTGTLTLPVSDPDFTAKNVNTEITAHEKSGSGADTDAGWNFVGNPYTAYYDLDELDYGYPITYWNGTTYESIRKGDDNYAFYPYEAFFVQKPEGTSEVGFDSDHRQTYTQSAKTQSKKAPRRKAAAKNGAERQIINLQISDGQNTDKTRVVFNAEKSNSYETDCDAAKFFSSENVPQLYTLDSKNTEYSINERPEGDVPVGIKLTAKGTYTISAPRMDCNVLLRDNLTGATYDLSEGAYSFEAEAGVNNTRFTLVFNGEQTAINNPDADTNVNADYYNVAGQKTTNAAKGVKIVKTTKDTKKVLTK